MFRTEPYTGSNLPLKALCLTYDDGPGKNTINIARFLHDENIRATFFVVGKYAIHGHGILEQLMSLGHLIGNHTYEHPDMPYYLSVNGDVQNQVLRTDAVIKKYIKGNTIYFRSPYGKWSSEVANALNTNMLTAVNHLGPIHWDVGGVDCYHWKNGDTVEHTVNKYLTDINAKQRGIVVMHDDIADMNFLKPQNNTLELTRRLIPRLKQQGYQFVRLDEIESIKHDASVATRFTLSCSNGQRLALSEQGAHAIIATRKQDNMLNEFSMEDLGYGKIALRASNELFLSLRPNQGNIIEAISPSINENEMFDLIPISSNKIVLRAHNGNYLTKESRQGGRLVATAAYMRLAECFSFLPLGSRVKTDISLGERFKTMRRQLLYIKSKLGFF